MTLDELRNEIDRTDAELVKLFCERMEICRKIGEYKKNNGIAVLDASREDAVIERVKRASTEDLTEYTERLYREILSLSKEYQKQKNG